jgi:SAM-dependent methyltransferase
MGLSREIIGSEDSLASPAGRYLLAWEQALLDRVVADRFGYHALQLGWPAVQALRANRMRHRWLLGDGRDLEALRAGTAGPWSPASQGSAPPALRFRLDGTDAGVPFSEIPMTVLGDFEALPFPAASIDLVVLPHTLERATDPHHTLREVERVLVSEGRVVVVGFNPASLWGLQHQAASLLNSVGLGRPGAWPWAPESIGPRRLRDWLRLLGFEVEQGGFGCYRPALGRERWMDRQAWLDTLGPRWWSVFGAVYWMVAVKRVRSMRLNGAAHKPRRRMAAAPAVAVHLDPHR